LHHSWFTQYDAYHPTVSPQGVPQVSCSLYAMSRVAGEREGMCSNPILYCNHTQRSTRVHTIGISLIPSHIRPMHFHITQTSTHTSSLDVLMAYASNTIRNQFGITSSCQNWCSVDKTTLSLVMCPTLYLLNYVCINKIPVVSCWCNAGFALSGVTTYTQAYLGLARVKIHAGS